MSAVEERSTDKNDSWSYISVVGKHYLWPIGDLIRSLRSHRCSGPNQVQASILENGYAASIVILLSALAESLIRRGQHFEGDKNWNAIGFARSRWPGERTDQLREVFVLRDVLLHNHLWIADVGSDADGEMKLLQASLQEHFGDAKYRDVVDKVERVTRRLRLNVFPNRVCERDACVAASTVLAFAKSINHDVARERVPDGAGNRPFGDVVKEWASALEARP